MTSDKVTVSRPSGLLLVNKPVGVTSHDVVAKVRRIFKTKEVGHTGTLDPIAEGLMILLLGEATKLSSYITEKEKQYEVVLKLGVETDSLDRSGVVLKENKVTCDRADVESVCLAMQGEFLWPVPVFSAVKVQGERLYRKGYDDRKNLPKSEAAQGNESIQDNQALDTKSPEVRTSEISNSEIKTPEKKMKFWDIQIQTVDLPFVRLKIRCSKGSYIRTWVQKVGEKLACGAIVEQLIRLATPPFELSSAVTLEALEQDPLSGSKRFIPVEQAMPEIPKVVVSGQDSFLLENGQISHNLKSRLITLVKPSQDEQLFQIHKENRVFLALIALEKAKGFFIRRVFRG